MKLAIALASAALLSTTSAFAADLAPAPVEPVAVITPYNWTGFYIGVHAGVDIGQGKVDGADFNTTGFIGGAHAGYNYQFEGPWVVGLETDIDYSSFSKSETVTDGAGGVFRAKFKNEWQGSTRARVGYAFDRFLPYITGGVAYGDEKISGLGGGSNSDTRVGWTAGAGLEYAIYDNWLVRGEVRYVDLGSHNFNIAGTRHKTRFDSTNITLGVSYKF
ncbi:outer membrane protein [Labrys okinawensis]|uniref:outer membrane protein n=1 Tax=Labrys okinawensis TaxID=346911 RepID=UPI0039BC3DF4